MEKMGTTTITIDDVAYILATETSKAINQIIAFNIICGYIELQKTKYPLYTKIIGPHKIEKAMESYSNMKELVDEACEMFIESEKYLNSKK